MRSNRQGVEGTNILESPWWFSRQTFNTIVGRAARANARITTAARSGLAVPPRWNEDFDTLVIFLLLKPGFAWAGPAAAQTWQKGGTTRLNGGLTQLWIPGLAQHEVRFKFFGSVEERL
jgi:hypothetical protein